MTGSNSLSTAKLPSAEARIYRNSPGHSVPRGKAFASDYAGDFVERQLASGFVRGTRLASGPPVSVLR